MISALRNRKVQIAGQAVVITALVGGTAAFVGLNKQVNLVVDGQSEQVRTFSGSVSDFLESQEIEVSAGDQVQPGADADITRGMDVVVNTAKDVNLTLDGVSSQETTTANTVGQALAELGVDPEGADISTDLEASLADGQNQDVSVVTPKTVTVVADGKSKPVEITAATAQEVIDEAGVKLGKTDTLSLPASAPVTDGGVVEVLRTKTEDKKETETVKKKVTEKKDDSLERGKREVETKGKDGSKEIVFSVTTVNGEVVVKDKKSEKVVEKPVDEVVRVGTKAPEPAPAPKEDEGSGSGDGGSDGGSDEGSSGGGGDYSGDLSKAEIEEMLGGPGSRWHKIAKCESEFNPRAVNPNGHYGLFQFKLATWQSVGGSGNPIDASPQEQFKRAKILQQKAGWGQWACA
ncbi:MULTISPECIES: resuscitation-promoting factor [Brevibacterium]|uniref:Resuscitation-promoting factor n=1 Tax=Brevibacterium salitolerans TaxID=1403566 RepID=A0ABP5IRF9_9MICO|nr:resuscitation-promoting factor [Brevibacterium sp.]